MWMSNGQDEFTVSGLWCGSPSKLKSVVRFVHQLTYLDLVPLPNSCTRPPFSVGLRIVNIFINS